MKKTVIEDNSTQTEETPLGGMACASPDNQCTLEDETNKEEESEEEENEEKELHEDPESRSKDDPIFQKGDYVIVKSDYDDGCDATSYRFCFTDDMIGIYGGKVVYITNRKKDEDNSDSYPVEDDGYKYGIDGDTYAWSSGMFERFATLSEVQQYFLLKNCTAFATFAYLYSNYNAAISKVSFNPKMPGYAIVRDRSINQIKVFQYSTLGAAFLFPTEEFAEKFLDKFRKEFEDIKYLI